MLDYDTFNNKTLPSEIRFSKLLPKDFQRWTRCRDHETETDNYILDGYVDWLKNMNKYDSDPIRTAVYQDLLEDIDVECEEVDGERYTTFAGVEDLARWEYLPLDPNRDTKGIQAWSTEN